MKRLFKPAIYLLVLVLSVLAFSTTAFADKCTHANTRYEQAKDDKTHSLICNDCGKVVEKGMRCYGGESGCSYRAKCTACGEEYGAKPVGHVWRVYDLHNALSFNELVHYDACFTCGEAREDSISEHVYGIWRITLSPTEELPGERARSCDVCGYVQTEVVPVIEKDSNMGFIIFLIIMALIVAGAGAFILVWLLYYKRTMRDLYECAVALGTDLKNIAVGIVGAIGDFFSIVFKSIALFFVKIGAFFSKIGRRIKGFFQTVGIVFNRCVRAVRGFLDKIRDFFEGLK
ncbi:MAG: hypothetical protein IJW03_04210 [Clostridia bacterium]|nr:hypothetical protein [Clostridia bacterium]